MSGREGREQGEGEGHSHQAEKREREKGRGGRLTSSLSEGWSTLKVLHQQTKSLHTVALFRGRLAMCTLCTATIPLLTLPSPSSYLYIRVSGVEECNERLMCRVLLELHFEGILPYVRGRGGEGRGGEGRRKGKGKGGGMGGEEEGEERRKGKGGGRGGEEEGEGRKEREGR